MLGCLGLLVLSELLARQVFWEDAQRIFPDAFTHVRSLDRARGLSASFALAGNSRALELRDAPFEQTFYPVAGRDVVNFGAGGATLRAVEYYLEAGDYKCIKPGGYLLLAITPVEVKQNRDLFNRTVRYYFGWREVLAELLPAGRWDAIAYFVEKRTLYLLRYRNEILSLLRARLLGETIPEVEDKYKDFVRLPPRDSQEAIPPAQCPTFDTTFVNAPVPEDVQDELVNWKIQNGLRSWYYLAYQDFRIDPYQLRALRRIIDGCRARDINVIFYLPPLWHEDENEARLKATEQYLDVVHGIAREEGVPVLDYVSEPPATKLAFWDGMHLADRSKALFLKKHLCPDLWEILQASACTP